MERPARVFGVGGLPTLVLAGFLFSLGGCARAWMPLDSARLASHRPKTITLVRQPPDGFLAQTPGPALLGMVGVAIMKARGKEIVQTNSIADPAIKIGDVLVAALAQKHGLTTSVVTVPRSWMDNDTLRVVQGVPVGEASGDLLLSVQTASWGFGGTDRYRFWYHFEAKLMDARSEDLLSRGDCKSRLFAPGNPDGPTYEELLADEARILKQAIDQAVEQCLDDYRTQLFFTSATRLAPPPPPPRKRQPVLRGESMVP